MPKRAKTCRASRRTTTCRARSSGPSSKPHATARAATRSAFVPVTSSTTRRVTRARPGVTSGRCAGCRGLDVNEQQTAAVEARGEVFVSAGAGTGKTTVLVERFVRAVCEEGLDVESVLVITYTRKAAGELRSRIRTALHARGRADLARRLDGAWISTIHGFCSRLLRTHPFAVGIDPRFRELDDEHGAVIRGESFERALATFCSPRDSERLRLLATYGAQGLRRMLTGVYETLRSAGRELRLELGEVASVAERLAELHAAAAALAADPDVTDKQL